MEDSNQCFRPAETVYVVLNLPHEQAMKVFYDTSVSLSILPTTDCNVTWENLMKEQIADILYERLFRKDGSFIIMQDTHGCTSKKHWRTFETVRSFFESLVDTETSYHILQLRRRYETKKSPSLTNSVSETNNYQRLHNTTDAQNSQSNSPEPQKTRYDDDNRQGNINEEAGNNKKRKVDHPSAASGSGCCIAYTNASKECSANHRSKDFEHGRLPTTSHAITVNVTLNAAARCGPNDQGGNGVAETIQGQAQKTSNDRDLVRVRTNFYARVTDDMLLQARDEIMGSNQDGALTELTRMFPRSADLLNTLFLGQTD